MKNAESLINYNLDNIPYYYNINRAKSLSVLRQNPVGTYLIRPCSLQDQAPDGDDFLYLSINVLTEGFKVEYAFFALPKHKEAQDKKPKYSEKVPGDDITKYLEERFDLANKTALNDPELKKAAASADKAKANTSSTEAPIVTSSAGNDATALDNNNNSHSAAVATTSVTSKHNDGNGPPTKFTKTG